MRRVLVLGALVLAPACDVVLGGLAEGHPRPPPPAPVVDAGPCADWLEGYAYRQPFVLASTTSARAVQVPLTFDTSAAIARGVMRADAADLRVTIEDGRTLAPHWRASPSSLWTKLDVDVGDNFFWIYYGKPDADDRSSLEGTFVPGVIDDPRFEQALSGTNDPWNAIADGFTGARAPTNGYTTNLHDGVLALEAYRPAAPNGAVAGLCQTMLFPDGGTYRFEVDVEVLIADRGRAHVSQEFLDATIWSSTGLGRQLAARDDIAPGWRAFCLTVGLEGATVGTGVKATFTRPRVRRMLPGDPVATSSGPEERRCE